MHVSFKWQMKSVPFALLLVAGRWGVHASAAEPAASVEPAVRLIHGAAADQDDLCFWRDRDDPARSLVIASDKKANLIAVYTLSGELLQTLSLPKPGNIDLRHDVRCGESLCDVVAVNVRGGGKLALFEVNRNSRQLQRLDDGDLETGPNYGVCLYHQREPSQLHAVLTSESGKIRQFEIRWTAAGRPSLHLLREWTIGKAEAAVADDESRRLYISEEEHGVWELDANPDQPAPGRLIVRLGEHALVPDLEGVALAGDWLLLSSQSQNRFYVYSRDAEYRFIGTFSIAGAAETDGIDVITDDCGPEFPGGIFGCHSGQSRPCPVLLSRWDRIAPRLDVSR